MSERGPGVLALAGVIGLVQACRCGDSGPAVKSDAAKSDATRFDAHVVVDAAVTDAHPRRDAAVMHCPPWRGRRADGHEWLYAQARSNTGELLTAANDVAFYVRLVNEAPPGNKALPDDPCGVAQFDTRTPQVIVLATALGFNTYFATVSPHECTSATPCTVELPRNLRSEFYAKRSDGGLRVKTAAEVGEDKAKDYAVGIGNDALHRARALGGKLANELDRSARATNVPAKELAIAATEAKLKKTSCDIRCLDDPELDHDLRDYLQGLRKPGFDDPFHRRTPPDRWRPIR